MSEPRQREVGGVHVEERGPSDAPAILWLGSLGSSTAMWTPQLDAFAGRFRCLAVDLPGHGASAAADGPVSIASLADRAVAVLDADGLDRAAVVGLSIGGMTGLHLAAVAPERVERLVALCTSARLGPSSAWHERAALVRASGARAVADAVVGRWFTPEWAAAHPDDVAAMTAMISASDAESYARCCEAIAEMDLRDRLPAISVPALVIAGASDPATPPDHGAAIASAIPGARSEVLPAAHLASWERAADVNALVAEFLEEP